MTVAGRLSLSIALVVVLGSGAFAQTTQDLKRMSLEQLMQIEVTTVSRTPNEAALVPAAVFVITQDDIRRSGARSIPEALRLAPGMQVARINGGTWAVGIRGFADRLARSMLVLIDGRAVYSPLFAGTYWETQDVLLSDIDRIEIIRGPGGTLWGSNAVNGIINIVTKPARETQGLLVNAGAGSEERGFGSLRYGGSAGALTYRAYVKAFDRGPEFHPNGNDYDGWRAGQGGFRADWALANARSLTLEGDIYDGRLGERPTVALYTSPFSRTTDLDAALSGGSLLMRLGGNTGTSRDYQFQMYYDRTNRDEVPVSEDRDTFDLDFQQTLGRMRRNTITWGGGYRVTTGRIDAVAPAAFSPDRRTDNLFSAFAQDEVALVPNRWRLTLGTKLEHNAYSGFELQPTARLLWMADRANTLFGSVTRAVRTPSRVETDYTVTSLVSADSTPTFVRLLPNPSFEPEKLVAYELGYRTHPREPIYLTVSGFYNVLHDTLSTELLASFVEADPGPARLILPVQFANGLHGRSYGAELTGDVRPTAWWRLTAGYSYLDVVMSKNAGSRDVSQERRYEGLIPHHQVQLGSSIDVQGGWSFDGFVRYVSELPAGSIPSYGTWNLRVGRRFAEGLDVSVIGQDSAARSPRGVAVR